MYHVALFSHISLTVIHVISFFLVLQFYSFCEYYGESVPVLLLWRLLQSFLFYHNWT